MSYLHCISSGSMNCDRILVVGGAAAAAAAVVVAARIANSDKAARLAAPPTFLSG